VCDIAMGLGAIARSDSMKRFLGDCGAVAVVVDVLLKARTR
jgi:hypothetical protein